MKKMMNLKIFGNFGKDFFTNAFNEAYNIGEEQNEVSEAPSEVVEETESVPNPPSEEIPVKEEETSKKPSKEEIKEMYEEYFGTEEVNQEPELDENTKSALELYKYLEENPHLVQAMRDVDVQGYNQLNSYVPDEVTKKVQELEEYIQEQKYNAYVRDLKDKFEDFNEEEVLEYAEEHEVYDLEIAYKALKSEKMEKPDMEELRRQIKEELLAELKQNSLSTQSVIGVNSQKPINQGEDVTLSNREQRIARAMGLTPSEYAKWR